MAFLSPFSWLLPKRSARFSRFYFYSSFAFTSASSPKRATRSAYLACSISLVSMPNLRALCYRFSFVSKICAAAAAVSSCSSPVFFLSKRIMRSWTVMSSIKWRSRLALDIFVEILIADAHQHSRRVGWRVGQLPRRDPSAVGSFVASHLNIVSCEISSLCKNSSHVVVVAWHLVRRFEFHLPENKLPRTLPRQHWPRCPSHTSMRTSRL